MRQPRPLPRWPSLEHQEVAPTPLACAMARPLQQLLCRRFALRFAFGGAMQPSQGRPRRATAQRPRSHGQRRRCQKARLRPKRRHSLVRRPGSSPASGWQPAPPAWSRRCCVRAWADPCGGRCRQLRLVPTRWLQSPRLPPRGSALVRGYGHASAPASLPAPLLPLLLGRPPHCTSWCRGSAMRACGLATCWLAPACGAVPLRLQALEVAATRLEEQEEAEAICSRVGEARSGKLLRGPGRCSGPWSPHPGTA